MTQPFRIDLKGDELHTKLGGGIPKNSIVLIEAPNGTGKSILAQRFTYGAVHNGSTVSYISTELSLVSFMNQMSSLNYSIKDKLLTKQLKFISLFPALGNISFRPNLVKDVIQAEQIFSSDIIVFDTLSEFLMKDAMSLDETFELLSFFKKIGSSNKSIILCIDPTSSNSKFFGLLKNVADVYIRMEEREQYGNKIKMICVERFNGAIDNVESEIAFNVKAGVGIVVELASGS